MKNGVCPKCGSSKIIEEIRVIDIGHLGQPATLSLEKVGPWNARQLTAYVCGDCGFTELYTLGVEGLWEAFQRAKK